MAPDDSLSSVMRDEVQKVFPLKLEEANFAKLLVEPKPTSSATEAVFFNTLYSWKCYRIFYYIIQLTIS